MQKRDNPSKSGIDGSDVFLKCVHSIKNLEERNDMSNMSSIIGAMCWNYLEKAKLGMLYKVVENNTSISSIYFSKTTKGRYIDLYENQLCKSKAGKEIYNAIKAKSVNCPACGFGEVSTLDHYLPKSKFPQFSVFPANLIPNCANCNRIKGSWVAKKCTEQAIHPYFDDQLTEKTWLYAEIIRFDVPFVNFYVLRPPDWSENDALRAISHLNIFKLKKRFCSQAMLELSNLRGFFVSDTALDIKNDLEKKARFEYNSEKNSWKTALYRELASNAWYYSGGHRDF